MPIENAIALLKELCPKVIQQGSMRQNERYPSRFFTFWNPETRDHKHYDNAATGYVWTLDVNFYSTDTDDVYSTLAAAMDTLHAAGWIVSGRGHAVVSDQTSHTGRGFTATFIET